jgi:hypothetical protein
MFNVMEICNCATATEEEFLTANRQCSFASGLEVSVIIVLAYCSLRTAACGNVTED